MTNPQEQYLDAMNSAADTWAKAAQQFFTAPQSTNFPVVNPLQANNAGGPRDVVVFKIANPLPVTATPSTARPTCTAQSSSIERP